MKKKFKATAKFFFNNRDVKRVSWLITDPMLVLKDQNDAKAIHTAEQLERYYNSLFAKKSKEEEVFTCVKTNGESSGIPFKAVAYWTLAVIDVSESIEEEAELSQ